MVKSVLTTVQKKKKKNTNTGMGMFLDLRHGPPRVMGGHYGEKCTHDRTKKNTHTGKGMFLDLRHGPARDNAKGVFFYEYPNKGVCFHAT